MTDDRIERAREKLTDDVVWRHSREELAWAAGFFDGEGSIIRHRSQKGYVRVQISLVQVEDRERPHIPPVALTRFLCALRGLGTIRTKSMGTGLGKRPQWTFWAGSFEDCQGIIALLWLWLSPPKRAQAIAALAMRRHWVEHESKRHAG